MPADGGDIRLDGPITQGELAAMVGSTRQSVNKLLGFFVDDGLIRMERDAIVDPGPGRPPAGGPPLAGRQSRADRRAAGHAAAGDRRPVRALAPAQERDPPLGMRALGRRDRDVDDRVVAAAAARGSPAPRRRPTAGGRAPPRPGRPRRRARPGSSSSGAARRSASTTAGRRAQQLDERAVGAALRRGERPAARPERVRRAPPPRSWRRAPRRARPRQPGRAPRPRPRSPRPPRPSAARAEIRTSTASCRA